MKIKKRCKYCEELFVVTRTDKIFCGRSCKGTASLKRRGLKKPYKPNNSPEARFSNYKKGAKTRSLEFNLSFDEFLAIINPLKPCFYCGECYEKIGIDRMNNNIGYIPGNCVSCCKTCNYLKSNLDKDFFIKKCAQIVRNFNKLSAL